MELLLLHLSLTRDLALTSSMWFTLVPRRYRMFQAKFASEIPLLASWLQSSLPDVFSSLTCVSITDRYKRSQDNFMQNGGRFYEQKLQYKRDVLG